MTNITKGDLGAYRLADGTEIPAMMTTGEIAWLADQARSHQRIVEIGSWCGGSTRAMADSTGGSIISIDDFTGVSTHPVAGGLAEAFYRNLSEHLESGKVAQWRVSSQIASRMCPRFWPDMVFIDGDHSYEAVSFDIQQWRRKLPNGSLLCGHDYHKRCPGVMLAVNELLPKFQRVEESIWWIEI